MNFARALDQPSGTWQGVARQALQPHDDWGVRRADIMPLDELWHSGVRDPIARIETKAVGVGKREASHRRHSTDARTMARLTRLFRLIDLVVKVLPVVFTAVSFVAIVVVKKAAENERWEIAFPAGLAAVGFALLAVGILSFKYHVKYLASSESTKQTRSNKTRDLSGKDNAFSKEMKSLRRERKAA